MSRRTNMVEFKLMETLQYRSENSEIEGEFLIGNETLWANRKIVAEIFGTTPQTISYHFNNIVSEGELEEKEVSMTSERLFKGDIEFSKEYLQNSKKGGRPQIWFNLDAIISIGYRINSKEATQFRKWSNKILKEYMVKGFVLDVELLKKGGRFTEDYFNELLETIREIRLSERRFNQKLTDLYTISFDYDKKSDTAKDFFANAQNLLIYAVTKHTAAEIIDMRSDVNKKNMGLMSWKNSPDGKILASDVVVSKNYLNKNELTKLKNLVDGFLTLAENRVMSHKAIGMKDWKSLLIKYIVLNDLPVLEGKGKISSKEAKENVREKFKEFRVTQDKNYISDYDQMVIDIKKLNGID